MTRGNISKKATVPFLIGTMAVLSACSNGEAESAADEAGTIEVWSRSGPEAAQVYETLFEAFTEETGIEVEYLATVEFETQLQARAAAQDLPDVMIYDQSSMASYVDRGFLLPVEPDELAGSEALSEASWDSVRTADGEHYGVPFSQHTQITFVRSDWREELGFDVPETHEELLELAIAFSEEDPDGNGIDGDTYGMAVPGTTDRGFFTWWNSSYMWQRGGEIIDGENGQYSVEINSPETIEALQWTKDLFCEHDVVQPNALSNASATPFFAEGQAGIYQTGPYAISDFDNNLGAENYEVIPTPAGPASDTTLTERTSIYFGASTEVPETQKLLAEFLISEEAQELGMTADGQPVVRLPVNENVDAREIYDDERWDVVADQLDSSKLFPSDFDFTSIRQDTAETLNSNFGSCETDLGGALDQLAETVEADLESKDALQ